MLPMSVASTVSVLEHPRARARQPAWRRRANLAEGPGSPPDVTLSISPYKTNVGASFPWADDAPADGGRLSAADRHGPSGYFHLSPGDIFVGGGMYRPEPARLTAFRTAIVEDRARVHAALEEPGFAAAFGSVTGDQLKRIPAGHANDDPDAKWLRLKDVIFMKRLSDRDVTSADLPDTLADAFAAAMPVMRFLTTLDT